MASPVRRYRNMASFVRHHAYPVLSLRGSQRCRWPGVSFSHAPPGVRAAPTMPAAGVRRCWGQGQGPGAGTRRGGEGRSSHGGVAGTSEGLPGADQVWAGEGLAARERAAEPGADARQGNATDHGAGPERAAAWRARVIKARGRRSPPQRDPPHLRWPGAVRQTSMCPAAQMRRQRRRPLTKPGRPWPGANESGCAWRDGPACGPPWREVTLACRPNRGDMTGIPELPGSLTGHGWARFRGSARRISSLSGR